MSSNATRASTLTELLGASIRGDGGVVATLCTDDVRAWSPGHFTASVGELAAEIERRDDAFSDIDLEVSPLDVGGEYACAEWRVRVTHTGALALRDGTVVEPSGERLTLHGVTVAEFDGDRICSLRQYWDEFTVFEQLGLVDDDRPQ